MHSTVVLCVLGVAALAGLANGCSDAAPSICPAWVNAGLCKVAGYAQHCKKSCGLCDGGGGNTPAPPPTPRPPPRPSTPPPPPPPPPKPGQCGYKPRARIVGGTEAPKGAWPWQAQIRTHFTKVAFCGGTLVHQQFVVTAAHCVVKRSAGTIQVRLGAHKRRGNVGTEQELEVEKIITHQSYKKPRGLAHDIAILKLKKPAVLNSAVNLACLPESSGSVKVGKMCWVTGFGRLSSGGARPESLMQVDVPVVSQDTCKKAYGSSIHDSMICAGLAAGGKDSCQGDSGGPMVCEAGGKFYLEGVVSFGKGCAAKDFYGVYARVRYLRQWVDETIRNN